MGKHIMNVVKWGLFFLLCGTVLGDEALTPDERIIALTILGEARGEGKEGMLAVACVIQRRTWERDKTPAQICRQPRQFSVWDGVSTFTGKPITERDLWYLWDSRGVWHVTQPPMYARELARRLNKNYREKSNCIKDITNGANHYHNKTVKPYWTFKKVIENGKEVKVPIKPVKIIGNHLFYKLP